jgi:hypothetical protein
MKKAELSNDVIEHILRKRSVYIVTKHTPNYEFSSWEFLGVYGTLQNAKRTAIRTVLQKDLLDFELYDPKKRFHKDTVSGWFEPEETLRWNDRWHGTIGVSNYCIETWKQDDSNGLEEKLYFNFDRYLKNLIVESGLSSKEVYNTIKDWKARADEITFDCFDAEQHRWIPSPVCDCRERWQTEHGYEEAYPFCKGRGIEYFDSD